MACRSHPPRPLRRLQGLVGDSNETTTLLTMLAERYQEWGQAGVAVNLLRRAVVQVAHPASITHMESMLEASAALGRALAAEGSTEEAITTLRHVANHGLPSVLPGHSGALGAVTRIRAIRKAAATAAASLLSLQGRDREAARMSGLASARAGGAGDAAAEELATA
jgi:hypothetical protein